MDDDKLVAGLAGILEISPEQLGDDFELSEENWDSFAILSAIALIDSVADVTIGSNELVACRTVGHLRDLIRQQVDSA